MIFKNLDDLCSYARKIGKENLSITVNIRSKLTDRIYKRSGSFVAGTFGSYFGYVCGELL